MLNFPSIKNIENYIDARFPILYIYTYEEAKVDRSILDIAGEKALYEWNGSDGFKDIKEKTCDKWSLEHTLSYFREEELARSLLIIKDADEQLQSDQVIALLKGIASKIREECIDATVIIISPILRIPQPLEKLITVFSLDLPDEQEIGSIVDRFVQEYGIPEISPELRDKLSVALKGLSEFEIEDLLRLTVSSQNGKLTERALELILSQKQQIILKSGILELIPLKEEIGDIGGLENLKEWLKNKSVVFKDIKAAMDFGVAMPKGVLITGIPGCGKSLSAKATGKLFNVPLLRLDMGRLMGKYVGESEENLRKAIRLAEAISPCVLWVDELEKAFAGIGNGGGGAEVVTRLFGMFLTWMQEKTSAAFVVATANDITQLPPELMRKGRFDEIFYVSLPNEEERRKIFEIHLRKRRNEDVQKIDIEKLASKTNGYSGADIEGVVCESIEAVYVKNKKELTTDDILNCMKNTHPLAEIMKESIEKLSKVYEERKLKAASKKG